MYAVYCMHLFIVVVTEVCTICSFLIATFHILDVWFLI